MASSRSAAVKPAVKWTKGFKPPTAAIIEAAVLDRQAGEASVADVPLEYQVCLYYDLCAMLTF